MRSSAFGLVLQMAMRSLVAHAGRSAFVGAILVLGTMLVMVGLALLDSIEESMASSITESMTGDLQVYSNQGRDDLALFGSGFAGIDEIGRVERIDEARRVLESVPGVETVVPMGVDFATITTTGELEQALARLRSAAYEPDFDPPGRLLEQARELVRQVESELERRLEITSDVGRVREALAAVRPATELRFWEDLRRDPLPALEYLDTKVAVHAREGELLYFRYLGTDIDAFVENFDRFELVEGEVIPSHTRGIMFSRRFREERIKHKVARALDRLKTGATERDLDIAVDPLMKTIRGRMRGQWRRVTDQLDAKESAALVPRLAAALPEAEPNIEALVQALLDVDNATIVARHTLFYEAVAPYLDLYAIDVGDVLTIRAFTRSGFLKAVNVRLHGVFRFRGLEASDLAGSHNLIDLVTFRELYGLMTPTKARELDDIRRSIGVEDVDRAAAESALFGDEPVRTQRATYGTFDEFGEVDLVGLRGRSERIAEETFDQQAIEEGMALNIAVLVEPGRSVSRVAAEVQAALEASELPLQVEDWLDASGLVGQFAVVIRAVLYVALIIIFAVALVIINNALVSATLDRIPEIGTMRAIGAQRNLVLLLFVLESGALALLAGTLGVALGAGVLGWLQWVGIPAWHQVLLFLFGGPRLYPSFGTEHAGFALLAVTCATVLSALYPARLAASVPPIEALRDRE